MKRPLPLVSCFWLLASITASAIVDTNDNGLSDLWEKQYHYGELFPEVFDPQADDDGDGWTNTQEAAAGTNPFDSNPPEGFLRPHIVHIPAVWSVPDEYEYSYLVTSEAVILTWPTTPGKQYTLLASADLSQGSWLPVDAPFIGNGSVTEYDIPLTQPDGSIPDKLFWRVATQDTDSDDDGLNDYEESLVGSNPWSWDTDGDYLADGVEVLGGTSPMKKDSDGDWIPDGMEIYYGYDPTDAVDGMMDSDFDGLPNQLEYIFMDQGYGPFVWNNADAFPWDEDPDHDDLTTRQEFGGPPTSAARYSTAQTTSTTTHTNPRQPDTDGDRLPDGWETSHHFDPNDATGTNGTHGDPDSDGAYNFTEWQYGTDPQQADTDNGGVNDGPEITRGTDPNNAADDNNPPPPGLFVEVPFRVGDPSGSHSETWIMRITGTGQDDYRTIKIASPTYGEMAEQSVKLRKGSTYEIVLQHFRTDPDYLEEYADSDYDWEAQIDSTPVVPTLRGGETHDAAGNDAFFMIKDHWLVDNRDGLLGTVDQSFDSEDYSLGKKAVLYPVDAKEVWSDQIPDVEANGYPDKTGNSEYPYILIGADSEASFKVKVKLYSDIPLAAQDRLLYRWAYEGLLEDFTPDFGTSTFSDPKTVRLDIDLLNNGDNRYLVVGFDKDSDGILGFSEKKILLKTPHIQKTVTTIIPYQFIPVTQSDYNSKKEQLLGWAVSFTGNLPHGSRHLTAFCNGAVPIYAGSEPTTIARSETGLSHPVGAAFTPVSNPGVSFNAIISKDHQLSKDLAASNAMNSWLVGEFNAVRDEIRREIVDARTTGGIEKLPFLIPATIKSVGFGLSDPDLLVSLGKVVLLDPLINFDVDMYGYVHNVKIIGTAEDLYDFDYGGGDLMGLPARPASMVQTGFPTLGEGGKVFKTKIDLGGNNPYTNPDIPPYTFFPY